MRFFPVHENRVSRSSRSTTWQTALSIVIYPDGDSCYRGEEVAKRFGFAMIIVLLMTVLPWMAVASGLASSETSDGSDSWTTFGGNFQRTGLSEYNTSGGHGDLKWKVLTDVEDIGAVSLAIAEDGTIYAANGSALYSIGSDGSVNWVLPLEFYNSISPSVGNDGTVYIASLTSLVAVFPNGTVKWEYETEGFVDCSPAIGTDGTIYISNSYYGTPTGPLNASYGLHAIYPNGTMKWRCVTGPCMSSQSPAIGLDGTIYTLSRNIPLLEPDRYQLNAVYPNGTWKWIYPLTGEAWTTPTVAPDGTVYIGCYDSYLYAIMPNGTLGWRFKTEDYISNSPAVGPDGTIYISVGTNLYSISPQGEMNWKHLFLSETESHPAIDSEGTVFVCSWNSLMTFNPDGSHKWEFDTGASDPERSGGFCPAIGSDGTVYFGTTNLGLFAVNKGASPSSDSTYLIAAIVIVLAVVLVVAVMWFKGKRK